MSASLVKSNEYSVLNRSSSSEYRYIYSFEYNSKLELQYIYYNYNVYVLWEGITHYFQVNATKETHYIIGSQKK